MATGDWEFSTLAHVWEYRNGTILKSGDRLDALSGADRERSLAELTERVQTLVAQLDDGWLLTAAFWMVDDIYKSFFREFGWNPGVHDYLAATAGVVVQELTRRGFALHYVVDALQPDVNLETMLALLPAVYQAAGLAVIGPQLAAVEITKRVEGHPPTDMAALQRYRDEGHAIADELVTTWHQEGRSSVYLNLDRDDGLPGLALDVAVSAGEIPGAILVFRNSPPTEDSEAIIKPPAGVAMPAEVQRLQARRAVEDER